MKGPLVQGWRFAGRTFARLLFGTVFLCAMCPPLATEATDALAGSPAVVQGKVLLGGKPAHGALVLAYTDARDGFHGRPHAASPPAAADGSFSLTLEPGSYFLVTRRPPASSQSPSAQEDVLFGYYGGNPVSVGPGSRVTVNLQAVRHVAPVVTAGGDPALARVTGVVLGPSGPIEGALVHVYASAARHFRGPDLFGPQGAIAGGTDPKGGFSIELPPGTYSLVASQRKGGDLLGPLQPGDLHGYFDGNPLVLSGGTVTAVTLQVVEKLRETAAPPAAAQSATVIRGRVRDPSGAVPKGVYAFATTDPSFMIGGMPPYRSQPLAADGSFSIELPAGDTYYVSARSGYGGPPLPGEWHGFYGEKTPRPIAVETSRTVEGIDFVVRKME